MGGLLGPVGGLERLKGSSQLSISAETRYTFRTTLGGARKAYRGPTQRRVWEASVSTAKPEQWQMLSQLEAGLTPGTLVWYDELSQVTNILPPDFSIGSPDYWDGANQAGSRSGAYTHDGLRFLRSVQGQPGQWVTANTEIPIPYGHPVVVSAYVTGHSGGTAVLEIQELDPEGVVVALHQSEGGTDDVLVRHVLSFESSERTVAIRMRARNVLTLALPAITFTKEPVPWAVGRGCLNAVVEVQEENVQAAYETPADYARRSSYSFTVTELG